MDFATLLILVVVSVGVGFFSNSLLRAFKSDPGGNEPGANPRSSLGVLLDRDPNSTALKVTLDGESFQNAGQLSDLQRTRLRNLYLDLSAWLREAPPVPVSRPEPEQTPRSVAAWPSPADAAPTPPLTQPAALELDAFPDPKAQKTSLNPLNILSRVVGSDSNRNHYAPKSIVGQVNDILQEKIRSLPHLARLGIELSETLEHKMVVVVGAEKYDGIEAVPDEEIKNLIRQSAAEWSSRAGR